MIAPAAQAPTTARSAMRLVSIALPPSSTRAAGRRRTRARAAGGRRLILAVGARVGTTKAVRGQAGGPDPSEHVREAPRLLAERCAGRERERVGRVERAAARGRIEGKPAPAREIHLDPGVCVSVDDCPGAVFGVVAPAREAGRDSRWDSEQPQHEGHRAGEVLAVAPARCRHVAVVRGIHERDER